MYNWICVSICFLQLFFNWATVHRVVHFSGAVFGSLATGRPTACLSSRPIWLSLVSSDWRSDHILCIQKSHFGKEMWESEPASSFHLSGS